MWPGIFSKTLFVWTRIFFYTDKKRCVFINIRISVDGALDFAGSEFVCDRLPSSENGRLADLGGPMNLRCV